MTRRAVISGTPLQSFLQRQPFGASPSSGPQGTVRTGNDPSLGGFLPFQVSDPSCDNININAAQSGSGAYIYTAPLKPSVGAKEPHDGHPHPHPPHRHPSNVFKDLLDYSGAERTDVNARLVTSILAHHGPSARVAAVPLYDIDFFGYFAAGNGILEPSTDSRDGTGLSMINYLAPARRSSQSAGAVAESPLFAGFELEHKGAKFTGYFAQWAEGFNILRVVYVIHDRGQKGDDEVDKLVVDLGGWSSVLRNEVWVFDQGWWSKSAELWRSIQKANWGDIILEDNLKEDIIADVARFFRGKQTYDGLGVAWKRGILLVGPPGNGKTITIKALSKMLWNGTPFVPTLYVKSFKSFAGDEFSIKQIFIKAREQAPCILALEDLDAFITDQNRSFFFNEIDGLIENEGIYIIASTNHPERLDPGITKRPSRFDRKYTFPNPGIEGRRLYCKYWQHKLRDTPINFNDDLLEELVQLMDKFSFAYMKEAFVSTLLVLAARRDDDALTISFEDGLKITSRDGDDDWAKDFEKVIKKQIETLREQIGSD